MFLNVAPPNKLLPVDNWNSVFFWNMRILDLSLLVSRRRNPGASPGQNKRGFQVSGVFVTEAVSLFSCINYLLPLLSHRRPGKKKHKLLVEVIDDQTKKMRVILDRGCRVRDLQA